MLYVYKAKIDHVWDGDTFHAWVDLGFDTWRHDRFRLIGVDTPEIRGASDEEESYGNVSKRFVEKLFAANPTFLLRSEKSGKYNYLAEVFLLYDEDGMPFETYADHLAGVSNDGVSLATYLVETGHAVSYDGGTKLTWEERRVLQDQARETFEASRS